MKKILQRKTAFVWVVAATCLILLVPLVAMQFSSDVRWTFFDFMVMGALLLLVGSLLMLLSRKISSRHFPILAAVVLVGFLYVWVELAVGIFFSFGN